MTLVEEGNSILLVTVTGVLSASAVASSTALIFIPNVETITLFIFFMGIVLPRRFSIIGTLTTIFLFEFVASATWGPSGFIFLFKLISWLLVNILSMLIKSGIISIVENELNESKIARVFLFGIGILSTLIFDFLTNLGVFLFLPQQSAGVFGAVLPFLLLSLPFTLLHCTSNAILFAFVLPSMIKLYAKKTEHLNLTPIFSSHSKEQ